MSPTDANDKPDLEATELAAIDRDTHNDLGPSGRDAVEPDETPDRFLIMVGVGLTVSVLIFAVIAVMLFDSTLQQERAAKGYTTDATAATAH